MQGMDVFLRVITSIPGIDNHDANSVIFLSLNCIHNIPFIFIFSFFEDSIPFIFSRTI